VVHGGVLEWCTDVYRRNPGAYEHMRAGGFLALPHMDTVRKRAAREGITSDCERSPSHSLLAALPAPLGRLVVLMFQICLFG